VSKNTLSTATQLLHCYRYQ